MGGPGIRKPGGYGFSAALCCPDLDVGDRITMVADFQKLEENLPKVHFQEGLKARE